MRPSFPIPQCLQPEYLISLFPPAISAHPRNIPGKTFLPPQPLLQKELLGLEMVLRIAFQKELFHLLRDLGHFADSITIP